MVIGGLSKHITIDKYGACYGKTCDNACEQNAIADSLFYLALENSICKEYVTEKFWRLRNLIVPIVSIVGAKKLSRLEPKNCLNNSEIYRNFRVIYDLILNGVAVIFLIDH
jgi:hypothetical protein